MFTPRRVLAGATVIGALAIAGPVAAAGAAPIPTARATVAVPTAFHGYGNPRGGGYGSPWNRGGGYGSPWNRGGGYGYGMPGPSASVGGSARLPGVSAGVNGGVGIPLGPLGL
jgi:hypothetical protein